MRLLFFFSLSPLQLVIPITTYPARMNILPRWIPVSFKCDTRGEKYIVIGTSSRQMTICSKQRPPSSSSPSIVINNDCTSLLIFVTRTCGSENWKLEKSTHGNHWNPKLKYDPNVFSNEISYMKCVFGVQTQGPTEIF